MEFHSLTHEKLNDGIRETCDEMLPVVKAVLSHTSVKSLSLGRVYTGRFTRHLKYKVFGERVRLVLASRTCGQLLIVVTKNRTKARKFIRDIECKWMRIPA